MKVDNRRIRSVGFACAVAYLVVAIFFAIFAIASAKGPEDLPALIAVILFAPAIVVGSVLIYALPALVAFVRHHANFAPIAVVNLAIGWSGLGWLGVLAWSLTAQR